MEYAVEMVDFSFPFKREIIQCDVGKRMAHGELCENERKKKRVIALCIEILLEKQNKCLLVNECRKNR